MGVSFIKYVFGFFCVSLLVLGISEPALASIDGLDDLLGGVFGSDVENDLSDVSQNIIDSVSLLPGLLTAISYLLALLFGVTGVLKLKEHVENPANVPLRTALARFLIGGGLLALPIIYEAMAVTLHGGENVEFDPYTLHIGNAFSAIQGIIADVFGTLGINKDFNYILASIISSVRLVPGLITGVAYLLGLLFGVTGLLKLKEHIENPEQNPLKEAVIRLLIGGALFALPTIYKAMEVTITGDGAPSILGILNDIGTIFTNDNVCGNVDGLMGSAGQGSGEYSLGNIMCNLVIHTGAFSAFLTAISYLFGLVLGLWGILKIQEHVLNPQTSIWEGISRFIAAGAFFALPFVIEVFKNTVAPLSMADHFFNLGDILDGLGGFLGGLFGGGSSGGPVNECNGLDGAVSCFVKDIFAPLSLVLRVFASFAGMVLIMIGISRLMKSAQEGARGPGGIGTMMTFLTGGALISYNQILGAFTSSFFNISGRGPMLQPVLQYAEGLTGDEIAHTQLVISAILQFMVLIGLISFIRGIFIIRNVAEGDQQASMMAGMTHMAGGTLAVNLGPLLNAVQMTLGITGYGIVFS